MTCEQAAHLHVCIMLYLSKQSVCIAACLATLASGMIQNSWGISAGSIFASNMLQKHYCSGPLRVLKIVLV
jgi:hypothetical protein